MPPVATARQTPTGIRLEDGYQSFVTFANNPDLCLWEKTVKPPGLDGGDKIPTTTMHNTARRTFAARNLYEASDSSFKFGYDPNAFSAAEARGQINVETTITITFPDGSTYADYGYLQKIEFDDLAEGTNPEGTATIVFTGEDPTTGAESAPAYTNVSGT